MTPRFRHDADCDIDSLPIVRLESNFTEERDDEIARNSVLSSFIFNLFAIIHDRMSRIQASTRLDSAQIILFQHLSSFRGKPVFEVFSSR